MAEDFPSQGGDSGDWGTKLINFFKEEFHLAGSWAGQFANVSKENQVVCKNNQIVMKVDRSIQ